ncbi:MAG: hypothetical protein L6V95_06320 [Candidatus Melainabacteria bacterium]|nr:MAG: hypothetical protein L6V95_06320 [Candidatus Melainabacteria bacterium]
MTLNPRLFSETTSGTFSFIIPAFSNAILSIVSPRRSLWSIEIEVIIDKMGFVTTFVASNLPPSPVSKITTSAFFP